MLKYLFYIPLIIGHFSLLAGSIISSDTSVIAFGGNAYLTSKGGNDELKNKSGIVHWNSEKSKFSLYFKNQVPRNCSLFLQLLPGKFSSQISCSLGNQSEKVLIKPDQTKLVFIGNFFLPAGYQSLNLEGITKQSEHFASISSLVVVSETPGQIDFVKDDINNRFYWGLRGPSVHLSYTPPPNLNIKWFYNEVSIPIGMDPIGSYFMANGFAEGYFGIQVNSATERRILFSVWSPFQTDHPESIPEDQKIRLLKKGALVYSGEFGNEGAGGQSYLRYPWKAGKTYQFLNSVEPDGKGSTIYAAYFKEKSEEKWVHIATFKRPKTNTWYKRPHSFVENFEPRFGYLTRFAQYHQQWVADALGNWMELTDATFTGDDIAKRGYRKDYEGGEINGAFYLKNGGFFDGKADLKQVFHRDKKSVPPKIDWEALDSY